MNVPSYLVIAVSKLLKNIFLVSGYTWIYLDIYSHPYIVFFYCVKARQYFIEATV